jgi:hypothetical protein
MLGSASDNSGDHLTKIEIPWNIQQPVNELGLFDDGVGRSTSWSKKLNRIPNG